MTVGGEIVKMISRGKYLDTKDNSVSYLFCILETVWKNVLTISTYLNCLNFFSHTYEVYIL